MAQPARTDEELLRMLTGYMPAFLISAAMRLELFATFGPDAVDAETIARRTASHAPSLLRVLRGLAALDLLTEESPGTFRMTDRGRLLLPDTPGSVHAIATVLLDESMWGAWPALEHAVRSGKPAFEYTFGTDYMSYTGWADGSELREHIDRLMLDETRPVAAVLVESFDFSRFSTVVDIGGGSGPLTAAVLVANPHLRGVIYDRADGLRHAPRVLAEAGVEQRCELRVGDFFASVPEGDLHLCKSVLFNWADDDQVSAILRNSRRSLEADGRLLLVEHMLPDVVDGSMPWDQYVSDVNSVVSLGGRLRTESEYRMLLAEADFDLVVHRLPTAPSGYSLLEAVPA